MQTIISSINFSKFSQRSYVIFNSTCFRLDAITSNAVTFAVANGSINVGYIQRLIFSNNGNQFVTWTIKITGATVINYTTQNGNGESVSIYYR